MRLFFKIMNAALFLTFVVIQGCITTNVKGYVDPDYKNYTVRNLAVMIDVDNITVIDSALESVRLNLKSYNVMIHDIWDVVPITKSHIPNEIRRRLLDSNIGTILYFKVGVGRRDVNFIGSYNNSTTNVYGNTAYTSGTSIPIATVNRSSSGNAKLINVNDGSVVWFGRFNSESGGALYAGVNTHVDSAINEVLGELIRLSFMGTKLINSHIPRADQSPVQRYNNLFNN